MGMLYISFKLGAERAKAKIGETDGFLSRKDAVHDRYVLTTLVLGDAEDNDTWFRFNERS